MFTLTEPSEHDVAEFISSQANLPFTYAEVGATQTDAPAGYKVDHNRVQLGSGVEVYERAVAALRQWRQFDLGWVTIAPKGVEIKQDAIVAVKALAFGMWSLNACRVVYVVNEDAEAAGLHNQAGRRQSVSRFGFAYGTLPDHIERGEERFLIEWNRSDDSVWYDILAFSHPRHPVVRLAFPVARMMQKRFARESLSRMRSIVS